MRIVRSGCESAALVEDFTCADWSDSSRSTNTTTLTIKDEEDAVAEASDFGAAPNWESRSARSAEDTVYGSFLETLRLASNFPLGGVSETVAAVASSDPMPGISDETMVFAPSNESTESIGEREVNKWTGKLLAFSS